jgi:guanosine-3',5'-bis(diphosphate) 3'-pyrophosphohydrolase
MKMSAQKIFKALEFASWQHRFQRRKGFVKIPYINHPIKVASLLTKMNDNPLEEMILAAILHDVVEDTGATIEEIKEMFGEKTAIIVSEVTDDMTLPSGIRKKRQVLKAPMLSPEAKQIKIADKICNIHDLLKYPISWTKEKKKKYIKWSQEVVNGCRGVNEKLEREFDEICREGFAQL